MYVQIFLRFREVKLITLDICRADGIRKQTGSTITNPRPYIDAPDGWSGFLTTSPTTASHSRCSSNAERATYCKFTRPRLKTKSLALARDG
jgi:hypothetical protein